MVFSSYIFLFSFLPLVLGGYYALPWVFRRLHRSEVFLSRSRNLFLLLASYVFYGWWNPKFILLMLLVSVVNYTGGRVISYPKAGPRQKRAGVTAAVVVSLSLLGFFKYGMFFQTNINEVLSWFGVGGIGIFQIVLPMGISFYTFQAMSYSIDVYRGDAPPARSLADFACYIASFPQLVAGPIVRYRAIAQQLIGRDHSWEKFASGVSMFVLGLSKKVLLANPLGGIADAGFGAQTLEVSDAWFGVTAYAFQIYFDFSGYSDMAVGLGRMIGFEFMKNFDAPYRAVSITDFWRRWHISLSTFLRDYLYIPLGGNRRGPRRTYLNLAIVMLLGGLWHGANWTFVVWGAYHGLLLAFERYLGKESVYHRLPRLARVVITFVLVLVSWVFFRCSTLHEAVLYLAAMIGLGGGTEPARLLAAVLYGRNELVIMALAVVVLAWPVPSYEWSERLTWPKAVVLAAALTLAVMAMCSQAFNPFLYFQF